MADGTPTVARPSSRRQWAWLLVGLAAGVACLVPAHAVTEVLPIAGRSWFPGARAAARDELLALLGIWWALFAVTAGALLRAPRRAAVAAALALGLASGVASLASTAVLSNDLYRYSWDGRVQAAGINPYRYPPSDPRLASLRDGWLWPSARECAARGKPSGCTLINRPDVVTIYPPAAQLWFRFGNAVLPRESRDRGWEWLGLALATITSLLLLVVLTRTRRDPRLVVLWTTCPAVALEAVQNAHVDALAAVLVVGALAVTRRRPVVAGGLLGVAGLVKLFPLVLLSAVIQRRRVPGWLLGLALVGAAYVPYLLDVGSNATGYLPGYLQEQGYRSGTRFVLLWLVGVTGVPAKVIAVGVVLGVCLLAAAGRLGPPASAGLWVFVVVLYVATPGEPWYGLVLVVLVALTGAWQWLGVIIAEYVGYLFALLGGPYLPATGAAYATTLAFAVAVTVLRRRRDRTTTQCAPCSPAAEPATSW